MTLSYRFQHLAYTKQNKQTFQHNQKFLYSLKFHSSNPVNNLMLYNGHQKLKKFTLI